VLPPRPVKLGDDVEADRGYGYQKAVKIGMSIMKVIVADGGKRKND
jgi:hypothetical protein